MRSPLEDARARIESFCQARARADVAAARSDEARREASRAASKARLALGSGELRATIEDAVAMGLLEPGEHGAMLAQLARAARDEVLARRSVVPARASESVIVDGAPRTLGELLAGALTDADPRARERALASIGEADDRHRARRLEALAEAAAIATRVRARGPRAADAAPEDLPERAALFLDATEDAAREVVARAAHAAAAPPPRTVLDVLGLLRAPRADVLTPVRERSRRLASVLAPLGLDGALSRVQMGASHVELDPDARLVSIDPPHQVRILPSSLELGLASELALCRAIGGALAASSVAPALPPAIRRAWPGSVGRGIGELLALLLADPLFVRRARELDGAAAEALRRGALACSLLRARALAARAVSEATTGRERIERGAAELARALAVSDPTMPAALADPGTLEPEERDADLRAALLAPSLAVALRDRFDEDWFRNPRAAEPLRAASARGAGLSIEAWAEELGASAESAPARIAELAR